MAPDNETAASGAPQDENETTAVDTAEDEQLVGTNDLKTELEANEDDKWTKAAFDLIITTIHDFCIFMRDLYVPDDAILVPPGGGWPEITKESFARFGKSDKVIEVLRHFTYIEGGHYEVLPMTPMADYRDPSRIRAIRDGDVEAIKIVSETTEAAPPDVVGLVLGGREVTLILLDCGCGHIYATGSSGFGLYTDHCMPTVEEYFGRIKQQFRAMELLP
ncbi:hypothetical protein PMZ80_003442 [Knufia obscura]|uniref:Uncharacterized protein n=2 Tax=Knufia TaxID=430999 RepID=A0AAN8ICJ2_9EURO|nr:hypothetical protein PMZ80_003442 [Knufia obscura]KAK5958640.1 hypothetical protein OHC33_000483 [Knufia fluminis]